MKVNDGTVDGPTFGPLNVVVGNVAPTLDLGGPAALYQGDTLSRLAGFIDPGSNTWTVTVDYDTSDAVPAAAVASGRSCGEPSAAAAAATPGAMRSTAPPSPTAAGRAAADRARPRRSRT